MAYSNEQLEAIFRDMEMQRSFADGVADYINALSSMVRGNRIDPSGKRIRETFSSCWCWDDVSVGSPIKHFDDLIGSNKVKDPNIKQAIPVVPLPFDKHYIASLKPLIRPGHPLPTLTRGSSPVPANIEEERKSMDAVAKFLHYVVGLHLNDGELPDEVRRDDIVSEQSLRYGISGYKFSKLEREDRTELVIEAIPRESVYFSDNGRFVGLVNTIYYTDPDFDEFDFDWDDTNPAEQFEYVELYDRDERVTYFLDRSDGCKEVKKSEEWEAGQDYLPMVFDTYGDFDEQSGQYTLGYIWPWAMIWEEMIVALSCIAWYSWESNKAKLIIAGNTSLMDEQKELLDSPHAKYVEIASELGVVFHNFKPIESTQEWVNYWNFLHNLLVQFQFLPNISRGLESPQTSYMKTGTAQIINQTRTTFAEETIRLKKRFYERMYKRLMDFLGANPDIDVVSDFLVENTGIVQPDFLRKDYNIDVSIDEIKAEDKDQKQQQYTQLLQATPALLQVGQMLMQMAGASGIQFDAFTYFSKAFEGLNLPPLSSFTSSIPVYGGATQAPPIGVQPLLAQLSQMGQTALADDIVNTGVSPELQDALAQILMQSPNKEPILLAIEEALGLPDPQAALTAMIQRSSGNARQ